MPFFLKSAMFFSICADTLLCRSFLYPKKKRTSIRTKKGAVMMAWSSESSSAGARPSKTPWPMNCRIQPTTCRVSMAGKKATPKKATFAAA